MDAIFCNYSNGTMLTHLSNPKLRHCHRAGYQLQTGHDSHHRRNRRRKSIILGALGLALGDRADRDVVRDGCERADISVEFDLSRLDSARHWLHENELTSGDDPTLCLLRRSVSSDGRSRAWINNTPATLQALAALGELLMDIHSQHEHHSLLKKRPISYCWMILPVTRGKCINSKCWQTNGASCIRD